MRQINELAEKVIRRIVGISFEMAFEGDLQQGRMDIAELRHIIGRQRRTGLEEWSLAAYNATQGEH